MTALADRYAALVAAGELTPDPDQQAAVAVLDGLAETLGESLGRRLFGLFGRTAPPPGAYLWGGVGRGKSMLMDLAFETIDYQPKRRVHFHEFMLEVHERLRAERTKEEGDPIPPVAKAIAAEARLLCFDEMVINNSADAMILSRLFAHLLEAEVTVITTSNRPPKDLYLGGLNRELFLPFIELVERELEVVPLNGATDYRLERLGGTDAVLAVIPGGRGNDFARKLGIPLDAREACAVLARGDERTVDVAEVDGRTFLGIASFGIDTEVQDIANATRRLNGQAVYLYATLRALASWKAVQLELSVDGAPPRRFAGYSVAACSSGIYGGGMRLAPDATFEVARTEAEAFSFYQELVELHTRGERDYTHQLWTLLMMELWFQRFID